MVIGYQSNGSVDHVSQSLWPGLHALSYLSLDHVVPLISHAQHKLFDVQCLLLGHLLQHNINGNERTSSPNTSTVL